MKTQISIVKKYVRESRSPFNGDDSTILLLATIEDTNELNLKFDRYVYLHRDCVGRWLGLSLSKSLEKELADGAGKYRSGIEMIKTLYLLRSDIVRFLAVFSEEVEMIFGMNATVWVETATTFWYSKLSDANLLSDW